MEKMHRRDLEESKKILKAERPNTLISVNNLALVLQDQGKYKKTEKIYRRDFEGNEKMLEIKYPNILINVSNLILIFRR
jgi:hypothetical protein